MKKRAESFTFVAVLMILFFGMVNIFAQNENYTVAEESTAVNSEYPGSSNNKVYAQWLWRNAEISSIFESISQRCGIDIVVDPQVTGKVTLHLKNKTWKEVVDILCKMKQLVAINEGEYIYILYETSYLQRIKDKEISRKSLETVKELKREIIKLQNVTADSLVKPINDILSDRGKITVVKHTNSIIVYDLPETVEKIKKLVKRLDVEVAQISISAKIIEVSSGTIGELGIQWSAFNSPTVNYAGHITHLPDGGAKDPISGSNIVSNALGRLTWGIIDPQRFSAAMEYLFTESKSDIVAQPQITTLDNQQARIFMGNQIPVTYLDEAGNTNVKMIQAGTELIVTPNITGDGKIRLYLKPKKESYTLENGVPVISEQSAETQVVVRDGETVVIAGLTSNEKRSVESGIPFLKDIPILGHLFKRTQKDKAKRDLIIFVTPHIIKQAMTSQNDMRSTASSDTSIAIPVE